jgi:hypothetical protein
MTTISGAAPGMASDAVSGMGTLTLGKGNWGAGSGSPVWLAASPGVLGG